MLIHVLHAHFVELSHIQMQLYTVSKNTVKRTFFKEMMKVLHRTWADETSLKIIPTANALNILVHPKGCIEIPSQKHLEVVSEKKGWEIAHLGYKFNQTHPATMLYVIC